MNRYYESPELNIRKYNLTDVTYTYSKPEVGGSNGEVDLEDTDDYDPFDD